MHARSCPHLPRFTDKQSWQGLRLGMLHPHRIPNGDLLTLIAAYQIMSTQQQKARSMENQHRKINGCRELSKEEIDLMNRIKEKGSDMLALQEELVLMLAMQKDVKSTTENAEETEEFFRFQAAEPLRWASIGKTDIQTGIMALVRAVAQPSGV